MPRPYGAPDRITADDARGFFRGCGYAPRQLIGKSL